VRDPRADDHPGLRGRLIGQPPLLLVLRALGLGDLLVAVPALRALAEAFPGHRRVLLTPSALAPLIGGLAEVVDHWAPLRPGAGTFDQVPATLAGAEIAVNLHGHGPESSRVLLAARPGRLLAFAHPAVPETAPGPAWDNGQEHERERWCRLLTASGIPADPLRLELDPPAAEIPAGAAGATLVHPGAASGSRRWPPERFAAVAAAETAAGRRVLVTGGPDEAGLAAEVAAGAGLGPEAVLAGRTTLAELAALVAAAGRVVCGDTGVAHLATAYGTPSVVLFGPVAPARWGPPPGRRHVALWAGRTGSPFADALDPGLAELLPGDVLDALQRIEGLRA